MKEFRFSLDKSSKKYPCPHCGKRRFVRYIDNITRVLLPEKYGRCDRQDECGYQLNPYKEGYPSHPDDPQHSQKSYRKHSSALEKPIPVPYSLMDFEIFKRSRTKYDKNNFIQWLIAFFGESMASDLIGMYYIGTFDHPIGATVFWQIDIDGRIRAGKIMLYDPKEGKRVRGFNGVNWVHSTLEQNSYALRQCFFGEHLLKNSQKPIMIVESEKTAIIASAYYPGYIWLATGGLEGLNADKCKVLKGRKVTLIPDLREYEKWSKRANEISHRVAGVHLRIIEYFERNAGEADIEKGSDIADFLIRTGWESSEISEDNEEVRKVVMPVREIKRDNSESKMIQKGFPPSRPEIKATSYEGKVGDKEALRSKQSVDNNISSSEGIWSAIYNGLPTGILKMMVVNGRRCYYFGKYSFSVDGLLYTIISSETTGRGHHSVRHDIKCNGEVRTFDMIEIVKSIK